VVDPSILPYGLGYDNSVFIDDDNKWYLVVKNGQPNGGIVELGDNGQATGVVYDLNWLNPSPAYPYSWAEGPVMWKYNGYYYYSFARDLAGGQKVMRSKTLTAEQSAWEMLGDFFNETDPQKSGSLFTSPNHASQAVMLGDSTSWVIHPLYAKGEWKGQGRQGLLNQVRYNASGKPVADYPINQSFTAPNLPSSGIPWAVPKSDDFSSDVLNPEWSNLGYTLKDKSSLTDRPGWLRLTPKSSSRGNYLSKNEGEHNYSLITRVYFQPKSIADEAGLQIMRGDETKFVKLSSSLSAEGKKVIRFSFDGTVSEIENTLGDTIWFKIVRINHKINGYFGQNGIDWTLINQEFNVSVIDSYSDFTSFTGTRQGLFVQGTSGAYFDLYVYRDAYTPILAECPANQYGTSKASIGSGNYALDNIHPNDWVLYAGVEFGNSDYPMSPDSVVFNAACAISGGTIEVWLDSIGSGTKISECNISPTGGLSKYKDFKSPVNSVTGNHDVYLRFVGDGMSKLFVLKSFVFTSSNQTTGTFANHQTNTGNVSIYPNPAQNELTIQSDFAFQQIDIYNLEGKLVFHSRFPDTKLSNLAINLTNGLYLLKISNNTKFASSKISIDLK
jgi:beta-xylosidase